MAITPSTCVNCTAEFYTQRRLTDLQFCLSCVQFRVQNQREATDLARDKYREARRELRRFKSQLRRNRKHPRLIRGFRG